MVQRSGCRGREVDVGVLLLLLLLLLLPDNHEKRT